MKKKIDPSARKAYREACRKKAQKTLTSLKEKMSDVIDKQTKLIEAKIITAALYMDWQQVVLNGGPPCFHLCEDGHFCGRAERWAGHKEDPIHKFVSLTDLLTDAMQLCSGRS